MELATRVHRENRAESQFGFAHWPRSRGGGFENSYNTKLCHVLTKGVVEISICVTQGLYNFPALTRIESGLAPIRDSRRDGQ
jgi:hypothetical protein